MKTSLPFLDDRGEETLEKLASLNLSLPFPASLPPGVREVDRYDLARVWRVQQYAYKGLLILADVSLKRDDRLWYHVSFSRKDRIPSYDDRGWVKEHFIGKERDAVEVLPKAEKHVNLHLYCLHLWHCLEGSPLPDFTYRGMI